MTCDKWDVVVVPFPFTVQLAAKRRPAVVLSSKTFNAAGHTVLCMVTSAAHRPWPGDVQLRGLSEAGLHIACLVRLKIFTLDNRLALNKLGTLARVDRKQVRESLSKYV